MLRSHQHLLAGPGIEKFTPRRHGRQDKVTGQLPQLALILRSQFRGAADPAAQPRHAGISVLLVEHGPGLTVSRDLPKLGYKGVESCELSFDGYRVPRSAILGGEAGKGFSQMMKGLETGRIQVASRALGVATAALDDALAYASPPTATHWPAPATPRRTNRASPTTVSATSRSPASPGTPGRSVARSRARSCTQSVTQTASFTSSDPLLNQDLAEQHVDVC